MKEINLNKNIDNTKKKRSKKDFVDTEICFV